MAQEQQFKRDQNGMRLGMTGMNTVLPPDILQGKYPYLQNVRAYSQGRMKGRATQSAAVFTLGAAVHSLRRLNDTTPAGPGSGFSIVGGAADKLYSNATQVASGLSGNPLGMVPFRPNASVEPWMYVADSSQAVTITATGFGCAGMVKVRSDGLTEKTGIREPQVAPTTTFPGGGSGSSLIYYRYIYRSSITGAKSNPSPESIPGTNAQASPVRTEIAAVAGVINPNISVNATQYEGNGAQIRTAGAVGPGVTTDYIIARNFGFTLPPNVSIDGVQIDLGWVGQNAGTGVLSGVQLYYLGGPIGNVKLPGIQNQSFSVNTLQGGNGDTWGATLTPAILNDATFGFGVQITTQLAGGSVRSFVNTMAITIFYSTQSATITPTVSADPQVDKIDIFRFGGGLDNFTYVGTIPNAAIAFTDTLPDFSIAANPLLEFDNFEPFPSIDLPRSGTLTAVSGVLTRVSGDLFNVRWLPGTIILIGSPSQVAYAFTSRPTSTSVVSIATVPDGVGMAWNIAEPGLAAQPMASWWGTTDNAAYIFACGDPLRPGTLYYTKGNNPDSAPDTNQIEVTSPSEPLINGTIANGIGMVFSAENGWVIYPNFTSALATVQGTVGQAFSLIRSGVTRGLYIRTCICTDGSGTFFYRSKDGIEVTSGVSEQKSITDDDIYNLFPHEGFVPQPITLAGFTLTPPDDAQPEKQKLRFATGYLYYDYVDTGGSPHSLVFDVAGKGFVRDVYQHPVTVHVLEEGPNVNGVLVGCADGTVRTLVNGGAETATCAVLTPAMNGGDARGNMRIGDIFLRASVATSVVTVAPYTSQYATPVASFSPATLAVGSGLQPYIIDFPAGLGQEANDIELVMSWATNTATYLDLWQPDWTELPESTQDRPTDWTDAGMSGPGFWQGLTMEADTFNSPKAIKVQSDDGAFHIPDQSPVTFNGQSKQTLTFTPPFIAHSVRVVSTDGVPWRMWGSAWTVLPFPPSVVQWQSEMTSLDGKGWQHIREFNIAHISTADLTLTLVFDRGASPLTMTLTVPHSSGLQTKTKITGVRNKFKLVSFRLSSTAPFRHFQEDMECKVGLWGREDGYRLLRPFGGQAAMGATL